MFSKCFFPTSCLLESRIPSSVLFSLTRSTKSLAHDLTSSSPYIKEPTGSFTQNSAGGYNFWVSFFTDDGAGVRRAYNGARFRLHSQHAFWHWSCTRSRETEGQLVRCWVQLLKALFLDDFYFLDLSPFFFFFVFFCFVCFDWMCRQNSALVGRFRPMGKVVKGLKLLEGSYGFGVCFVRLQSRGGTLFGLCLFNECGSLGGGRASSGFWKAYCGRSNAHG